MKPRLLDISRLISRVGRGRPTGIDRVELAYFRAFLDRPEPAWFISRMPGVFAIFDKEGGRKVYNQFIGDDRWQKPTGWWGRLRYRGDTAAVAQRATKKHAFRTVPQYRIKPAILRAFPDGVQYFNVGHSTIRPRLINAIMGAGKSEFITFVHDVIPIEFAQYTKQDKQEQIRRRLRLVANKADLVIYNSEDTRQRAEQYFQTLGRVPDGTVAHLGLDVGFAAQGYENAGEKPNFCIVSTIEPRKNHMLLLKIWQEFAATLSADQIPDLHIIGRRGWENHSVFNTLDTDPMVGKHVFEHNDMSDAELKAHLGQSWGLLFPSFAEGFGLPLIEAAAFGIPIICGENAIYREILGDYPLYLDVDNSYVWAQRILERAGRLRESEAERQVRGRSVTLPDWNGHFDQIFRFV